MSVGLTRVLDAPAIAHIVRQTGLDALYDLMIRRIENVIPQCNEGTVAMKERDGFLVSHPYPGLVEWMPAIRTGATVVIKAVGYQPRNPTVHRLPTILSTLYLFDAASGHLRLILDGTFATALRTGAASAVASRLLAVPSARVLGLVGCGAQAVTQAHALSRVFTFDEVLVSDTDPTVEASFASRLRSRGGAVRVVPLDELERRADILCTATSVAPGDGPVITGDRLLPHVHINAVGSDMIGKTELPRTLLRRSVVCPDHRGQAMREGECQQLGPEEIGPSLFDLVADPGRAESVRPRRTIYDSTGLAVHDLAAAELLETLAADLDAGVMLPIEANTGDPQDPYAFLEDRTFDRSNAVLLG